MVRTLLPLAAREAQPAEDLQAPAAAKPRSAEASHASIEPHFKRLRALLKVIETGNLHRAAEALYLTPATLSKAVQRLEREVATPLVERTHKGVLATVAGHIVARRAQRAIDYLDAAEQEVEATVQEMAAPIRRAGFAGRLTYRHLQAAIAVGDWQSEATAAERLHVSPPAISSALRELEELVGQPLFQRTPRGMVLTVCGEIVVRQGKLALREIESASADLAAYQGMLTGRVVVGVLPSAGTRLLSDALTMLLSRHEHLNIVIFDGAFKPLMQALRCGDVDVIVGTMSAPTPVRDMRCVPLVDDSICIVARAGHPLAALGRTVTGRELMQAAWVVPRLHTPSRMALDMALAQLDASVPAGAIECNSLPTVRALLSGSDRLSAVSSLQLDAENGQSPSLVALPIDSGGPPLALGAGTRGDALLPDGVAAFIEALKTVAREQVLTPPGRFDLRHVDLRHLHHRFEGAPGRRAIGVGVGLGQHARRDLP